MKEYFKLFANCSLIKIFYIFIESYLKSKTKLVNFVSLLKVFDSNSNDFIVKWSLNLKKEKNSLKIK